MHTLVRAAGRVTSQGCLGGAVVTCGTLILPPYFDPGLMLDLIAAERPASVTGVPAMFISMLDHPGFRPGRHAIGTAVATGGAVVPPALAGRAEAAFAAPVSIVFAQAEAFPVIAQTLPRDIAGDRAHTLGRPLPQTEVKIIGPAPGQIVAPGVIGELCTRGYHVMTGYSGTLTGPRRPSTPTAGCTPATWPHGRARLLPDRRAAHRHDHPRRDQLPA